MDTYQSLTEIIPLSDSVVTIGTYDGLHRGHQEIVKRVVTYANATHISSVAITFDPHPRNVLNPESELVSLIMNLKDKLALFSELGVDYALVIPFTDAIRKMTANKFLNDIVVKYFSPSQIIIGYDHHFGFHREGSPEFLSKYAKQHCFGIDVVDAVSDEGALISSTHIRGLITDGYVRRASFELGWVYGFQATVVHGVGRGEKMTFPTANFIPVEKSQLLPKPGVYLTRGIVDGHTLHGMCNLGVRPTFDEGEFVMEVHFFEKKVKNLYGRNIRIEFLERIRDEKKFSSEQTLIEQLKQDKKHCIALLAKYV